MKPMNINGFEITFTERPKHKSVVAAKGIMTTELLNMMDLSEVDPTKGISDFLKDKISEDPDMIVKLSNLKSDLSIDQTIILATGLEYSTLQEIKEEMYADEFIDLFEKSKESLGGKTAEDFFAIYPTSMTSKEEGLLGL